MEKAKSKGVTIHLPSDFITGNKFAEDAEVKPATLESGIDSEYMVKKQNFLSWDWVKFIFFIIQGMKGT